MQRLEPTNRRLILVSLTLVLFIGIFVRLPPGLFSDHAPLHWLAALHPNSMWHAIKMPGFDEDLYRQYVEELSGKGLSHYPDIVMGYIEKQLKLPGSILPPVRFLFIFTAYLWQSLFRADALASLRNVASFFSILTLGLAALFAWRVRRPRECVALTALVAFAPTQVHMSQHALVDGFFTFWTLLTLWMLWENLQAPRKWGWLAGYAVSLALLVLTKENSFFVWLGIVVVLIANRWLHYGTVSRELVLATVLGPLAGVVVLIFLAGGADVLVSTYRLLIFKNYQLPFAIKTGDGPWSRYLVDLLLVSPVVIILAIGAVFRIDRSKRFELFLLMFIAGTYLIMCNIKYGMNLRYANMWDVPLRFLALSAIVSLTAALGRWRQVVFVAAIVLVCAVEYRQYIILFIRFPLYELVTGLLLRASNILK
ncbi:MAG: phospholipid carrier-dependent glycosyltransferase [Chthoniobacterales bacterium]